MANTSLRTNEAGHRVTQHSKGAWVRRVLVTGLVCLTAASPALAQAASVGGLCSLYTTLKAIAGAAALIAVAIFVINSFFGKSSLISELTVYVIIGCSVLVFGPQLIAATGLSPGCS